MTTIPYVKQTGSGADQHRNDCGPACALMIARARGRWLDKPLDDLYDQIVPAGDTFTGFTQLKAALAQVGIAASVMENLTAGNLLDMLLCDRLMIALVAYGPLKPHTYYAGAFTGAHFVVPVNISLTTVTFHDPLTRADVVVPIANWMEAWEKTPGNSVRYAALIEDVPTGPAPEAAEPVERQWIGEIGSAAGANLRTGPGTGFPRYGPALPLGARVTILGVVSGGVYDWLRVLTDDGRIGYVAGFLVREVERPVSWPPGRFLRGVHGRTCGGDPRPADFAAMHAAGIEAVKHMSSAAPELSAGAAGDRFQVVRLFADFNGRVVTATDFCNWLLPDMERWYRAGVRWYEIHNEPNLSHEGMNASWGDGSEFADWWLHVRDFMRHRLPGCKWGFPGCSPGGTDDIRLDMWQFLRGARPALQEADWIGVHCYWTDAEDMLRETGGRVFVRYLTEFPSKPLLITEFSNPAGRDLREKGYQYAAYYKLLQGYPEICAAFGFAISGPGWEREAWVGEDGRPTEIVSVLSSTKASG